MSSVGAAIVSFASIAARNNVHDDDTVDQLNHWATVGLLAALAVSTGAKQFVGEPIKCWLPVQYKKSMFRKYANNYCWISKMYYVPFSDSIPWEEEDRYDVDITFYRWVTVMFLVQALLFKLPNLLWTELKSYSGLNVEKVVGITLETSMMPPEDRQKKLSHAAVFMHRWLQTYTLYKFNAITKFREQVSSVFFCFGKRTGTYLTGLYMFIKTLYVVNIIGQFFLMSAFLDLNYWNFGLDAMSSLAKTGGWQDHYTFPRIGMCDYKIRQMANVQTFSVQCVLSVNLFLEKMYLMLWFWMVGLLVANVVSVCLWFIDDVLPARSERFMFRYASMLGIDDIHDKTLYRLFAFNYLRRDGIFILRMVAKNTSNLLCMELVKELWKCFNEDLQTKDHGNGTSRALPSQPTAAAGHLDRIEEDSVEKPALH